MDLEKLRASDGTGPAALANIESDRSIAATTIDVDNVENWPDEFIVVTGTLDANGYLTPASMCQMVAHLDGGNIEIDSFVPGYSDTGNTEGQVAIIKQTVHGQNSIVDLLEIAHNADGEILPDAPLAGDTTLGSGWLSAEEEWLYASFDAATDTGTLTVPTDATTKYSPGMRIRFTQATGGVKYGIITKVTATVLTVHFGTDYTLNNEDITVPCFATVKAPLGFPLNPIKWTLTTTSANDRATTSTSFASLVDTLVVPIGSWLLLLKASLQHVHAGGAVNRVIKLTLSSDASTETNPETTLSNRLTNTLNLTHSTSSQTPINVAAATTFTMMGKTDGSNSTCAVLGAAVQPTVIKALNAYL
jgi:hypothetical protein